MAQGSGLLILGHATVPMGTVTTFRASDQLAAFAGSMWVRKAVTVPKRTQAAHAKN